MIVAVYQRALKLLYVDELLERLKAEFAEQVRAGVGRPTHWVRACVRESQCMDPQRQLPHIRRRDLTDHHTLVLCQSRLAAGVSAAHRPAPLQA